MLRNAWQLPALLVYFNKKVSSSVVHFPIFHQIGNFHLTKRFGETMMEIENWKRYR